MPRYCFGNADWPSAIIFDLDGTLIDSAPDIAAAVNRTLNPCDAGIDAETARRYLGDGARRLIARVLGARGHAVGDQRLAELTERFNASYETQPCRDTVLYAGVETALACLKANGVALAICTNKPQPIANRVVSQLALNRYVDIVTGAGRYALKPDPEPLLACLSALDCDRHEALYIGDMRVDREAARAAGVTVLIADFGYSTIPAFELGADGVLADWASLDTAIADLLAAHRPRVGA